MAENPKKLADILYPETLLFLMFMICVFTNMSKSSHGRVFYFYYILSTVKKPFCGSSCFKELPWKGILPNHYWFGHPWTWKDNVPNVCFDTFTIFCPQWKTFLWQFLLQRTPTEGFSSKSRSSGDHIDLDTVRLYDYHNFFLAIRFNNCQQRITFNNFIQFQCLNWLNVIL